jgi:hypothetical protein
MAAKEFQPRTLSGQGERKDGGVNFYFLCSVRSFVAERVFPFTRSWRGSRFNESGSSVRL